jgi:hypothetical protein
MSLTYSVDIILIFKIHFGWKRVISHDEGDIYSACSNPANVVLLIVLLISDNAPINFGAPNIEHHCILSYPRQSLRQHQ